MKAIVLCGGLGTRLGLLTKDMPKSLLNVAGRPFIAHVLDRLVHPEITGLVLAAGFQWTKLRDYIGDNWKGLPVQYSVETEALGTGGAIKNALAGLSEHESIIVNGDTLFDIDVSKLIHFGKGSQALACLALRQVKDCSRYGRVTTDKNGRIRSFGEKAHHGAGLINGGIYYLHNHALEKISFKTFSFETDFLNEKYLNEPIYGLPFDDYFIDIGIPAELQRAQTELSLLKK